MGVRSWTPTAQWVRGARPWAQEGGGGKGREGEHSLRCKYWRGEHIAALETSDRMQTLDATRLQCDKMAPSAWNWNPQTLHTFLAELQGCVQTHVVRPLPPRSMEPRNSHKGSEPGRKLEDTKRMPHSQQSQCSHPHSPVYQPKHKIPRPKHWVKRRTLKPTHRTAPPTVRYQLHSQAHSPSHTARTWERGRS